MAAKKCSPKSPFASPKFLRKLNKTAKTHLEDTGVHLDEGRCPAWDYTAYAPNAVLHGTAEVHVNTALSPGPLVAATASPAPSGFSSLSKKTLPHRQKSYSESEVLYTPSKSCGDLSGKDNRRKISKGATGERPNFTHGADVADEDSHTYTHIHSSHSAHKTDHKSRFRKILPKVQRSHSAGSSKDLKDPDIQVTMEGERSSNSVTSTDGMSSDDESGQGGHSDKKEGNGKKKKTFTQDVKDKLLFLRRRHTDTSLASKMAEHRKITGESLITWSKSIEHLFSDRNGLDMFREFLRTEFSDENLEFWIACQEYRQLKPSKMEAQANKIYADFVTIQAAREINLDSNTRLAIKDNLSSPNKHTFEDAQRKIQGLMERDSYPRFLNSEAYQKLLREHKVNT